MKSNKVKQLRSTLIISVAFMVCMFQPSINLAQIPNSSEPFSIKLEGVDINNVELLSRYLKIPSVSGSEKRAGEFLKTVCEQNGLYTKELGKDEGNFNFTASLFPLESQKPNIILLNHIDVVPPGNEKNWEYPPFQGEVINGEIWGRGTLDMKGVAVAQLAGLLQFKSDLGDSDFEYNVSILAVSAEELVTELGACYVVENYFDLLNPAVVFSEGPSGMKGILKSDSEKEIYGISVSDKKPLRIKLQLRNNTFAHGASSPEHYPAKDLTLAVGRLLSSKREFIYNDLNVGMLKDLGELETGIMSFVMRYPRLFKPIIAGHIRKDSRMMIFFSNTITLVDYKTVSHSANSIPQCLECRFDCRLMPEEIKSEFIGKIRKIIDNDNIDIIIIDSLPGAKASRVNGRLYANYEEALKESYPTCEVVPAILPGYSDCIQFRCKEIPAYGSHPFPLTEDLLATFHNFNERIPVTALNSGAKVYYDFLSNLAQLKN